MVTAAAVGGGGPMRVGVATLLAFCEYSALLINGLSYPEIVCQARRNVLDWLTPKTAALNSKAMLRVDLLMLPPEALKAKC